MVSSTRSDVAREWSWQWTGWASWRITPAILVTAAMAVTVDMVSAWSGRPAWYVGRVLVSPALPLCVLLVALLGWECVGASRRMLLAWREWASHGADRESERGLRIGREFRADPCQRAGPDSPSARLERALERIELVRRVPSTRRRIVVPRLEIAGRQRHLLRATTLCASGSQRALGERHFRVQLRQDRLEHVLGADLRRPSAARLLDGAHDDRAGPLGEPLEHCDS